MIEEKNYLSLLIDVVFFDTSDVITTSGPVSGEDGDDIFDDRF